MKGCDNVLVAGSSWPKDEDIFIDYFNRHPEMKLILAPHEIHEAHLHSIRTKLKRPYVLYSQATEQSAVNADCLIIDCFGLLSSMYPYGRMAYVGEDSVPEYIISRRLRFMEFLLFSVLIITALRKPGILFPCAEALRFRNLRLLNG